MSILTEFNPKFLPFSLIGDVYIETGVCEGKSLINAIAAEDWKHDECIRTFGDLRGVELCWRHIQACRDALSAVGFRADRLDSRETICHRQEPNTRRGGRTVRLICGSSVRCMPELIADLPASGRASTWFLDAHWPGEHDDEWEPCDGQCPLLEELKIILSYDWAVPPVILVDDINQAASDSWWSTYFVGGTFDRKQWPTFQAIYDLLFPAGFTMLLNAGILYCWKDPYKTS